MKFFYTYLFILLITNSVLGQNNITCKVVDANDNTPLAGATITFSKNNRINVDADGTAKILCVISSKFIVSFTGYQPTEVNLKNCNETIIVPLNRNINTLDNVEITSTSTQNKSILYQPASIAKLTTIELQRGLGLFLDDAINANIPGMHMQRRTIGAGQQFDIRGYGNGTRGTRGVSSNFDGQGYKLYLNGIPVTDAEGITLMDDIDFASISNVEVMKGPAGTLYGLAIAGAVSLKTTRPNNEKFISERVIIGNYGTRRFTTTIGLGNDKNSFLINYGVQHVDGYMPHTASDKKFVNLVSDAQITNKLSISSYFGYSNSYDQRSGELTIAQYQAKDYSIGNIEYVKRNAHSNIVSFRVGLVANYTLNSHWENSTTIFGTGLNSNVSSAGGWADKAPFNVGLRSEFKNKIKLSDKISLSSITGLETQHQHANAIGYNMKQNPLDTSTVSGWAPGKPYWVINAITSDLFTFSNTTSLFTQWTLALPSNFSITAGLGWSNQQAHLEDRFNAGSVSAVRPMSFDTIYKNMISPHIAINKVFNKNVSAYISYSTGYKAPTTSYFYVSTPAVTTPITVAPKNFINNSLKPEIGKQFEIGTKGTLLNNRAQFQFSFFNMLIKNKMTNVAVPLNGTTTAYNYVVNGGNQQNNGIELFAKINVLNSGKKLFNTLTPFINFAYSNFKYQNFNYKTTAKSLVLKPTYDSVITYDYSGLQALGVPKTAITIGFDATMQNGVYISMYYLHRDSVTIGYELLTDNVNKKYSLAMRGASEYHLLNGKIGFRKNVSSHFNLDAFLGVDNINNTQYPMMIFINQLPDAYMAAPPKAVVYGGVNLKYTF